MKTLVFVACMLATVTMGDALISNIIETLMSKTFNIKELIEFNKILAECIKKVGVLKIVKPEISFCISEKKNLLDEEDGIIWDAATDYIKKLVRNSDKLDEIMKFVYQCKEKAESFEGSKKEISLKIMQCGLPIVRYIAQQVI